MGDEEWRNGGMWGWRDMGLSDEGMRGGGQRTRGVRTGPEGRGWGLEEGPGQEEEEAAAGEAGAGAAPPGAGRGAAVQGRRGRQRGPIHRARHGRGRRRGAGPARGAPAARLPPAPPQGELRAAGGVGGSGWDGSGRIGGGYSRPR